MSKLGGSGLLIAGFLLVILGAILRSGILQWLLEFLGVIIIAVGIAVGVYGLIKMFSGGETDSSDY